MNHERALTYALAGGPAPREAWAHIEACPECSAELKALRGVEERLKAAAPQTAFSNRVLAPHPSSPPRVLRSQRVWSTAAAACLALAFLATWVGQRPPGPASPSQAFTQVRAGAATYAWPGTEYGTPVLLDAVQEEITAGSAASQDNVADYLDPSSEEEIP